LRNIFNTTLAMSLAVFTTTGCGIFDTKAEKSEKVFQIKKRDAEQENELLRLERRKLLLQNSIDRLDAKPLPGEENAK
jgi:hypothetical protein